jgi:multiple sugar transport system substrate-binding protein
MRDPGTDAADAVKRGHPSVRSFFAWTCAALVAVVGCSGEGRRGAAGEARSSIAVLLPPSERPFWEPIAREFERAHPGTRVRLVEGPQSTDLRENLYTASLLARDPSLDLIYLDVTWTPKFAAAGWLRPLDDRFTDEEKSRFLPAALAAGSYRGHLYRIPVRTDVGVLYYRADLLARAGRSPPRTLGELDAAARALQTPPATWGYVWQGKQYEGLVCDFVEILAGHGGFWVDPTTLEVGLDRPEAHAALAFLVAAVGPQPISPPGVTTYQEEESRRLFQEGRAVFLRNWPYVWRLAQAEDSPVRGLVGVTAMPGVTPDIGVGTLGGWGLAVSSYSRSPELSLEFIRAATSLAGQRALCLPTGYAPARADAYDDPRLRAANPFLARLRAIHSRAVARPAIPRYALASDVLQRHLSAALAGVEPPESALAEAARETRALLGDRSGR